MVREIQLRFQHGMYLFFFLIFSTVLGGHLNTLNKDFGEKPKGFN